MTQKSRNYYSLEEFWSKAGMQQHIAFHKLVVPLLYTTNVKILNQRDG